MTGDSGQRLRRLRPRRRRDGARLRCGRCGGAGRGRRRALQQCCNSAGTAWRCGAGTSVGARLCRFCPKGRRRRQMRASVAVAAVAQPALGKGGVGRLAEGDLARVWRQRRHRVKGQRRKQVPGAGTAHPRGHVCACRAIRVKQRKARGNGATGARARRRAARNGPRKEHRTSRRRRRRCRRCGRRRGAPRAQRAPATEDERNEVAGRCLRPLRRPRLGRAAAAARAVRRHRAGQGSWACKSGWMPQAAAATAQGGTATSTAAVATAAIAAARLHGGAARR